MQLDIFYITVINKCLKIVQLRYFEDIFYMKRNFKLKIPILKNKKKIYIVL